MKTIIYLVIWLVAYAISIPLIPIVLAWDIAVKRINDLMDYLGKE